jgi:O-antigen ligase
VDLTRTLRIILTAAIAVTPLCLMTGVFLSHDVIPKVVVTLTAAAALLFLLPQWSGGLTRLWNCPRGRWFLALAGAQAVSLCASTIFSGQPALSFAGTVWRRFGAAEQIAVLAIAVAAACVAAANAAWVASLFRAVSVAGGIGAVYGIAQYFGIDPFLDPALYTIQAFGGIVRPPATMGHAIYFAAWLTPVALLGASAALADEKFVRRGQVGNLPHGVRETNTTWRRIHGAVALLACTAILLSGTRGAVLAVVAGGILLAVRGGKSLRGFGVAAGCFAVLVTLFAMLPAGENLRHRLYQWRQDLGGPRMLLWRESPALMVSHPLFGIGPETFAVEFRKIESAEMSRAYPEFYHETPHDALLDAATAQGIPGFLILAAVFILGISSKQPGIQAALLGIFVSSAFASLTIVEAIFLWTLTGIGAAPAALPAAPRRVVLSRVPQWAQVATTVTGALLTATALLLAVPDAAGQRVFDAVADKNFAEAEEAYRTAVSWSFGLPGYELFLSRQMATLGRALGNTPDGAKAWSAATEAAALAERSGEERFSAVYQSAVLAIVAGDLTRAERKAREAVDLAPNWYKPHLLLGQILAAMGKADEGAAEQRISLNLGPQAK